MKNIIDDFFSPLSKWMNKTFLNEQYGRTMSQRLEDSTGIPKIFLDTSLVIGAVLAISKVVNKNKLFS